MKNVFAQILIPDVLVEITIKTYAINIKTKPKHNHLINAVSGPF